MSQTTTTTADRGRPGEVQYQIAVRTAAVAGIFSLIVCALLLYDYSRRRSDDPAEATALLALKAALSEQPGNQQLREKIRAVDLQLIEDYFRQRAFAATGAWLLLGGVAVLLIAAKTAATLRRALPDPGPQTTPRDVETEMARTGRRSVAMLAVVLIAAAVGLSMSLRTELPQSYKELAALMQSGSAESPNAAANGPPGAPPAVPQAPPSQEEIEQAWPRFRGPHGAGTSAYTNVPDSWDDTSGKNIVWKTPVPLPGMNSPVVWGDRLFLSGATKDLREVYCFDTKTGEIVWRKEVPPNPQASQMREPEFTGYAAPTLATDGRFVCAIFADGELATFDVAGNKVWQKSLGIPDNSYGHASCLVTYRDLVLVQIDQGTRKQERSKLYGLQLASGETAWEVPRPVATSWTSPIVISHDGRDQLITCADPWTIAYDPASGKELWRVDCMQGEAGPSPIFHAGMVYVGNEYCVLSALRADGSGDVTETHVAWTGEDGLGDTCSPLATDEYVYLLGAGAVTCYDATDGTMLWEEYEVFDYPNFVSSPSLVGNRIYLFGELDKEGEEDEEGNPALFCKSWVIEPGREGCKVVGEGLLDEGCVTSPAFQDGRIYIRGKKHLFCIGQP